MEQACIAQAAQRVRDLNAPEHGVLRTILEQGRFAVVICTPNYCRATDAVVGEHLSVVGSFPSREIAQAFVDSYQACADERVLIECPAGKWPAEVLQPLPF